MKTTKMRLTIEIEYRTHGEPVEVLHALLDQAAGHLEDNGLLSGESDASVTRCTHRTEVVTRRNAARMTESTPELLAAIDNIVKCWQSGDLAAAVRQGADAAKWARGEP